MGVPDEFYTMGNPTLARGLDYYNRDNIIEVIIEWVHAGSVLGGGRYDKLNRTK